jgi:hypothetical protein
LIELGEDIRASFERVEHGEWSLRNLETSLKHALTLCDRQPSRAEATIRLDPKPQSFGPGPLSVVMKNFLVELAALTTLARTILAWDMADLISSCLETLQTRRFRVAALCTRTLLEELAYAQAFQKRLKPIERTLFEIRDSQYRPRRLADLPKDKLKAFIETHLKLREAVLRRLASQRISHRWSPTPAIRPSDYELPETDPQRQTSVLTVIDRLRFERGGTIQTARSHYDQLCEATHPNQLARGVYYESVRVSAKEMRIVAARPHISDELLDTATGLIIVPLLESISGLASLLEHLEKLDNGLHHRIQLLKVLV